MERLQKVIAASGITSRRKAEELIISGKVIVNGEIVTTLGTKVNEKDEILVDGMKINIEEKVYFLLNKPREVITSVSDEHKRKTVVDIIDTDKRIYPIGRLDYDTTGLLLLTNDGELANKLMHPKNNIDKVYIAKINGIYLDLTNVSKMEMIVASHDSINGNYKKLKDMFRKNSHIIKEEERLEYINTYCTDELRELVKTSNEK